MATTKTTTAKTKKPITIESIVEYANKKTSANDKTKSITFSYIRHTATNYIEEGVLTQHIVTDKLNTDKNDTTLKKVNIEFLVTLINYGCNDTYEFQLFSNVKLSDEISDYIRQLTDKDKLYIQHKLLNTLPGGSASIYSEDGSYSYVTYANKLILPVSEKARLDHVANFILDQKAILHRALYLSLERFFNTIFNKGINNHIVHLHDVYEQVKSKLDNAKIKKNDIIVILSEIIKQIINSNDKLVVFDCTNIFNDNIEVYLFADAIAYLKTIYTDVKFYMQSENMMDHLNDPVENEYKLYSIMYNAIHTDDFQLATDIDSVVPMKSFIEKNNELNKVYESMKKKI